MYAKHSLPFSHKNDSAKRLKDAVIRQLQQFFEYFPTIGYKPLADFYVRNIDYDNAVVELKTEGLTGKSCRSATFSTNLSEKIGMGKMQFKKSRRLS